MNYYVLSTGVFETLEARIKDCNLSVLPEAFIHTMTTKVRDGRHLTIVGDTAHIPVVGVLEKSPSFMSFLFGGGTIYGDIAQALIDAQRNDQVKQIVLEVDSPGGGVEGLQTVVDAMNTVDKQIIAQVTDKAASGGYWIASQADKIIVNNSAAEVGSIGVVVSMPIDDEYVTLTSTNAPFKRPDPETDEGRKAIIAKLDQTHERFATAIAKGRGTTVEDVNENYGRGRMVSAESALAAGMIDGIGQQETKRPTAVSATTGESIMDLKTLKAEHPEVFAAAKAEGVQQEKDRVSALLQMGTSCDAMDIATQAIDEGADLSGNQTLMANFMSAGLNKRDKDLRASDNPEDVQSEDGGSDDEVSLMPEEITV